MALRFLFLRAQSELKGIDETIRIEQDYFFPVNFLVFIIIY